MFNALLERFLNPLLEKTDGWKTSIGLAGLLLLAVSSQLGWTPTEGTGSEISQALWFFFTAVAGVGVASKDTKRRLPKEVTE